MMPGSSEWLIILGVALLIFGPSKLPRLGGAIGEGIKNFKKGMRGLQNDIMDDKQESVDEKDQDKRN